VQRNGGHYISGSTGNVIGSGSDSIALKMAEDQAQGTDAVFTVNVDGQQVGPAQTVTASQSAGQTEDFTFKGDWAPGSHDVTVTFSNNFLYPGTSGDRNLYVDSVTHNGQTVSSSTTPPMSRRCFRRILRQEMFTETRRSP